MKKVELLIKDSIDRCLNDQDSDLTISISFNMFCEALQAILAENYIQKDDLTDYYKWI